MTEAAAAAMATAVGETEAVQGSSVGSGPVSFLPMPPIASEAACAREYDAEEEDDRDDAKITAPALMSRTEIHEEGTGRRGRRGRSRMRMEQGRGRTTNTPMSHCTNSPFLGGEGGYSQEVYRVRGGVTSMSKESDRLK